jgi:TetR/AcrR family transcriptional regulator
LSTQDARRGEPAPLGGAESVPQVTWAERAADRSPVVQRSRNRGVQQATTIVRAARNLIETKGPSFTTQELIKEAGIALQTFYRYFPGKDHLLLAVIEDIIDENCKAYSKRASKLDDPVARLRLYVMATVESLQQPHNGPSFITSEHFRLQTLYPAEVSRATQPFTELLLVEIRAAMDSGQLNPRDPDYSAWLMTQLAMAVFHHYDCAGLDEPAARVGERVWGFCLAALNDGPPALGRVTRKGRRQAG